jgi:hypothetical protein
LGPFYSFTSGIKDLLFYCRVSEGVSVEMGILEPVGSEGSQFIVAFAATEYGKPLVGRRII